LWCDRKMYRFVLGQRGILFLGYFVAMHVLVNLTVATAAFVGGAQWLLSGSFRSMYDRSVAVAERVA
jgi:hypothetical protein